MLAAVCVTLHPLFSQVTLMLAMQSNVVQTPKNTPTPKQHGNAPRVCRPCSKPIWRHHFQNNMFLRHCNMSGFLFRHFMTILETTGSGFCCVHDVNSQLYHHREANPWLSFNLVCEGSGFSALRPTILQQVKSKTSSWAPAYWASAWNHAICMKMPLRIILNISSTLNVSSTKDRRLASFSFHSFRSRCFSNALYLTFEFEFVNLLCACLRCTNKGADC